MSYDKLKGGYKSLNGSRAAQQSNGYPSSLNDGSMKGKRFREWMMSSWKWIIFVW